MIPLWKPSIGKKEKESINEALLEGYLGHGSYSNKFEEKSAQILKLNKENILACSTGHSALHLIINALCPENFKIATPTFNNIADFQAILNNRCKPVLVDSSSSTNPYVSSETLTRCIKENKIHAFIALDYASNFCPLEDYYEICTKYGVKLIYDAAHSFGSIDFKRLKYCDAAMFSFDPIKTFTCIDAGLIYFKDPDLISSTKPKRFIGMEQNESKLKLNKRTWDYDCTKEGWRYHLSNIHASVGIVQIERLNEIKEKRINALKFIRNLVKAEDLPIEFYEWDKSMIPFMNVAIVNFEDKEKLRVFLDVNNIQSGTHWKPGHLFTKFKSYKYEGCENANNLYKQLISLPLYTDITKNELIEVCSKLKNFFNIKKR